MSRTTEKTHRIKLSDKVVSSFPELSREQAIARIVCGEVSVNGETVSEPKALVSSLAQIAISSSTYVSRGGVKLEYALRCWNIDPRGLVFLDAGSSTGGFTDCLLKHGASSVHAVDVGYNQLDYRLRTDPRVFVHEKQNIMEVESFDPIPDAAVADLSFRSITNAASRILALVASHWMVALVKPQFEVSKNEQNFDGVVLDPTLLLRILENVLDNLTQEGVAVRSIIESPVLGRKGNREFLALLQPVPMVDNPTTLAELIRIISSR